MYKEQMQVRDFHRACGIKVGQPITEDPIDPQDWRADDIQMRYNLIAEEVKELKDGIEDGNAVEIIDALCDILYVTYGFATAVGIDLEPFFEEVHRTNMLKCSGPKRDDGKQLKPEGWAPPRIGNMLAAMYAYYGIDVTKGATYEASSDQSDLQSRVLSVVKDPSGTGSFVPGSEVHGLLQEPPRGG